MFSTANVRTDVVEAKHVFTAGPVTRLVTSQARDSRAHASHTSREDFAKPVSLIPTCFIICLMGLCRRGINLCRISAGLFYSFCQFITSSMLQ